jgi:hypothetical protein
MGPTQGVQPKAKAIPKSTGAAGPKTSAETFNRHSRWSQLEAAKQRFAADGLVGGLSVGGGVRTSPGVAGGFKFATWDGMPVVRDDDMTAEGTIEDIALIDGRHTYMAVLRPFEVADSEDPFAVGVGRRRAVWYGAAEMIVDQFQGNGVLTDLQ